MPLPARGSGTASRNTSNAATGALHVEGFQHVRVEFAEMAEHARPEPQNAGAPGVIPGRRVGGGLQIVGRRARSGERRQRVGLRVVEIGFARLLAPVARAETAGAQPGRDGHLPLGPVVAIERPQLEQRDIRKAAIGVAPRRLDQVRQGARAHRVEIAADRVDEGQFRLGAAEQRRRLRRQERERDRLGQAALGQGAAHQLDPAAARRRSPGGTPWFRAAAAPAGFRRSP